MRTNSPQKQRIYDSSDEGLRPFACWDFWPIFLQKRLKKDHCELFQRHQLALKGCSMEEEPENVDFIREIGREQQLMVEKWLWNKWETSKKNDAFQDFLLYKQAKGGVDHAFELFFSRKQHEITTKPRFLELFRYIFD